MCPVPVPDRVSALTLSLYLLFLFFFCPYFLFLSSVPSKPPKPLFQPTPPRSSPLHRHLSSPGPSPRSLTHVEKRQTTDEREPRLPAWSYGTILMQAHLLSMVFLLFLFLFPFLYCLFLVLFQLPPTITSAPLAALASLDRHYEYKKRRWSPSLSCRVQLCLFTDLATLHTG